MTILIDRVRRVICALWFLVLLLIVPSAHILGADSTLVRGKITLVSGDAIYTSIGRKAGVRDSSMLYVLSQNDTIATLKVYAASSQSSVARIIESSRKLKVDDIVSASLEIPTLSKKSTVGTAIQDTLISSGTRKSDSSLASMFPKKKEEAVVTLRGRVGLQYYTNGYDNSVQSFTQPGLVFNIRGNVANAPIKFETYGNIRSLIVGSHSPFSSNSSSQTRIYRANIEYDDSTYAVSLGRIIPVAAPTVGYVDGAMFTKRSGEINLGFTAGYEPSYAQNSVSSQMKKFAIFGMYQSTDASRTNIMASYARTFYSSSTDREVVSSSLYSTLSGEFFITAQGDLDLRTKSGSDFVLSPRLTNVFSNLNYRISNEVTIGLGYSGWRPTYSFSSVRAVPDSFLDNTFKHTVNVTGQLYLAHTISLYHSYSPRSSDQSFGKEYLDNSTLSVNNILNSGITCRAMLNFSSTASTTTHGIGANVQRSFGSMLDVNVRYQTYKYFTKQINDPFSTKSFAIDLMNILTGRLSAWTSIERINGGGINGYNLFGELSWSF